MKLCRLHTVLQVGKHLHIKKIGKAITTFGNVQMLYVNIFVGTQFLHVTWTIHIRTELL
jgi:hypothetical protein